MARFAFGAGARPAASPDKMIVPVNVFGQLNETAEVYYYVPGVENASREGRFSIPQGTSAVEVELRLPPQQVTYLLGVRAAVATRLVESTLLPQAAP